MGPTPTFPKQLTPLASVSPTSVSTAVYLSSILTANTTHATIQAVGGTLYVRVGDVASSSAYGVSLAAGEKIDLYGVSFATISVQGTSVSALCWQQN